MHKIGQYKLKLFKCYHMNHYGQPKFLNNHFLMGLLEAIVSCENMDVQTSKPIFMLLEG